MGKKTIKLPTTPAGWAVRISATVKAARDLQGLPRFPIDIAAIACAIFSLTGLGLLWVHAGKRPSTWPLTGLGLVAPVLLYAVFVHT